MKISSESKILPWYAPHQRQIGYEGKGPVRKLRRIGIGPIGLGKLKPGDVRELSQREVDRLRDAVEKSAPRA